ncbi:MAG: peptidylprolyl isomerase [Planctomycetes bacterium]|nr:peptidylprolyl isomerase [Planctomycetota bacterium]MCW8134156.1 peptidylprolyl isomerase [Planctomycetota bacterium]
MSLEWAEAIISWGHVTQASAILERLGADETLLKADSLRVNFKLAKAALAERQADSKKAAEVYKDLLTTERKFLTPQQLGSIQQLQQFQLQAVEQWEDELKYRAEDAKKKNPRLVIETSKGKVVVELFEDDSPNTVKSLVSLAKKSFFDGLNFHRVIANFMAQGGCPKGNGTGSPGYRTKFEENKRKHFRGTFAMARSMDKNSQGSQFYICFANSPNVLNLSGEYVVAGRVIEGMDVVDKLRIGDKIKSIKAENLRDHSYEPEKLPE